MIGMKSALGRTNQNQSEKSSLSRFSRSDHHTHNTTTMAPLVMRPGPEEPTIAGPLFIIDFHTESKLTHGPLHITLLSVYNAMMQSRNMHSRPAAMALASSTSSPKLAASHHAPPSVSRSRRAETTHGSAQHSLFTARFNTLIRKINTIGTLLAS